MLQKPGDELLWGGAGIAILLSWFLLILAVINMDSRDDDAVYYHLPGFTFTARSGVGKHLIGTLISVVLLATLANVLENSVGFFFSGC